MRLKLIVVVVMAVCGLVTPSLAASGATPGRVTGPAAAGVSSMVPSPLIHHLRPGCHQRDKLKGGVRKLQHFMYCALGHKVRVVTVYPKPPPPALAARAQPAATPEGGGPPCQWMVHNWSKICTTGCRTPHCGTIICLRYLVNQYGGYDQYPHHCGAIEAAHDPGAPWAGNQFSWLKHLWVWVAGSSAFFWDRGLKACFLGMVSGTTAGLILKWAGKATPVGVVATTTGGCVSGVTNMYFNH